MIDCIFGNELFAGMKSQFNSLTKCVMNKWCLCVFRQAIERDKKLREEHESTRVENPIGTNDFDYEDKQKTQDNILVYEGLHFSLAAENSRNPFLMNWLSSLCAPVSYDGYEFLL